MKDVFTNKVSEQILNTSFQNWYKVSRCWSLKKFMADQKPLFKTPYDIKDVSALFAIVAFVLIIAAIVGNNLFGLFQQNFNFG